MNLRSEDLGTWVIRSRQVTSRVAAKEALHNTVILSATYPNAIEYRFPATKAVEIRYNLVDSAVQDRDGANGSLSNNVTNA